MKKYMIIFPLILIINQTFAQNAQDTIYISSYCDWWIKSISIIDTASGNSIILKDCHYNYYSPVNFVIDTSVSVLKVCIRFRFPYRRQVAFIEVEDFYDLKRRYYLIEGYKGIHLIGYEKYRFGI